MFDFLELKTKFKTATVTSVAVAFFRQTIRPASLLKLTASVVLNKHQNSSD